MPQSDDSLEMMRVCRSCGTAHPLSVAYCPQDGTKMTDGQDIGSQFAEKYELLELIGSGGMGNVYKARQILLNKVVAVKIIHRQLATQITLARFQQEARTTSNLNHPNLIRLLDFGIFDGQPYMVVEYLVGRTLAQIVEADGAVETYRALNIFAQVLDGLQSAHDIGVLHRDIKPSNIIVTNSGDNERPVLVDFGIAKVVYGDEPQQNLTRTGEIIGSPYYMSPEQCANKHLDERTDLYSLGCALFEALTGAPPFMGSSAVDTILMHTSNKAPTLKEGSLGKSYPPGLEEIVARLLEKEPGQRFSTANEVKLALKGVYFNRNTPYTNQAIVPANKSKKFSARNIAIATSLCAAALVAVLCTTFTQVKRQAPVTPPPAAVSDPLSEADKLMSSRNIVDVAFASNRDCPQLTTVTLTEDDFKQIAKNYAGVVALDLRFSTFKSKWLKHLANCKRLKLLKLANTEFEDSDVKNLVGLRSLQNGQFENDRLTDKSIPFFAQTTFNQLHLANNRFSNDAFKTPLPNILYMELDHNHQLGPAAIDNIVNHQKQMTGLGLGDMDIAPQSLEKLNQLPNLYRLGLRENHISKAQIKALAKLKTVEELDFRECHLDLNDLPLLSAMPALKELDLSGCKEVNDKSMPQLTKFARLKSLFLDHTDITNEGLECLAQMHKLKHLRLKNCHGIDRVYIEKLKALLPDCKIEYEY